MRQVYLVAVILVASAVVALGQQANQTQAIPSSIKNHIILLSPNGPPGPGETFWVAVAPDGQLAVLRFSELQEKMAQGFRPYTVSVRGSTRLTHDPVNERNGDISIFRAVCGAEKALVDSEAPTRLQLPVSGFAARTTRVGVMNRKFGNQRVTWFHPRLRRISAY